MQKNFLNFDHRSQGINIPVFLLLTVFLILNGCGSETYEQRLNETAKYFSYVDIRDQALAKSWSSPTVSLRAPVEFEQINAPNAAPAENSEETEAVDPEPTEIIDPRQPDYVDLELPGLEGAWRVEVPVDQENTTVDLPAYLYVLSNHYLLKEKLTDEALEFHDEVNNQLASAFEHFLNIDEFTTEKYPQKKGYSVPKSFLVGSFVPETEINGVPYQIQLYLAESGNNKVALLLVVPKNISGGSKLSKHMDFSLETVEIVSPRGRSQNNSSSGSNKF
ncbi:MAG: hypothetical protein QM501_07415 [Gimesia sp.]